MKPKENTIAKIDMLGKKLASHDYSPCNQDLIIALQLRCHSMNIHKATVAYFKRIKLVFTQALQLADKGETGAPEQGEALEREMRGLLDANNG